jgi:malonyl CoA-acyl carrier protein transacylase
MKNLVSKLTGLFGGKLVKIDKLTSNQLEDEKIRLQTVQEGFIKQVKDLEDKKRALFEEGRKKKSGLEKQAIAVQIKQVDNEAKDVIKASNILSRQILVTGKLSQIKKREKLLKSEGLWGLISSVEPEQLEEFMLNMKVKSKQGDAQSKRLLDLLGESEEDVEAVDPEISRIITAMEEAGEEELTEDAWDNIEDKVFKKPEEEEPQMDADRRG